MTRARVGWVGKRSCKRWTPAEDAHLVASYPDYAALGLLLPQRSRGAMEARLSDLGVIHRKPPPWTPSEVRTLAEMRSGGASFKLLREALPRRSRGALAARVHKHAVRLRRRYVLTGDVLIDAIRRRVTQQGLTLKELDRLVGSGTGFVSGRTNLALKHLAKAIEILGGELEIEWEALGD